MAEEKQEKEPKGNVVLEKFKKDQVREDKHKKWNRVEDATQAARRAYTGGYGPENEEEKTVSFEKALGDLVEVLQKIKSGELKLGGLKSEGLEVPEEE